MNPILPYFGKELFVTLRATEETDDQNPGAVDREQSPDTVELGGEDLEDHEREGELGESGADIGTLEGALGRAHFHNLVRGQDCGASPVHSQAITIPCTTLGVVRL